MLVSDFRKAVLEKLNPDFKKVLGSTMIRLVKKVKLRYSVARR